MTKIKREFLSLTILCLLAVIGSNVGMEYARASCTEDECDEISCVWFSSQTCFQYVSDHTPAFPIAQANVLRSVTPLGGTSTAHDSETVVVQECDNCDRTCAKQLAPQEGSGCANCSYYLGPIARLYCANTGCGVTGSWNEGENENDELCVK